MTVAEIIQADRTRLETAPVQCADPLRHMQQIISAALHWDPNQLYLRWNDSVDLLDQEKVETLLARRLTGEPFQYLVKEEYFWKSRFEVGPGVLIPRRETEHLLEAMLNRLLDSSKKIAELGAGSGNIGISACQERPQWEWHAFEIHADALPYLQRNRAQLLNSDHRYFIHAQDFFAGLPSLGLVNAVVSNPPYVTSEEMSQLPLEVRHEPTRALDGGDDGLIIMRPLIAAAARSLAPGGWFFCEIGSGQAQAVTKLMDSNLWSQVEVLKDYANLPRVLVGRKG